MKLIGTKQDLIDRWMAESEKARELALRSTPAGRLNLERAAMIWERCAVELELWQEESEVKDPEKLCHFCNGSGEGLVDGSICSRCRGTGTLRDDI